MASVIEPRLPLTPAPRPFPVLRRLVLEVTEGCNHNCLHCYNYWREQRAPVHDRDTLTRSEIRRLLGQIRTEIPLEQVALSGGEPLLRPDCAGIAGDLVEDGLRVTVITNGTLLTPTRLASMPRELAFEITLFSADEALHDRIAGRTGAFRRTLAGMVAARAHGSMVIGACVISALNAHDVRRTIELSLALGASTVMLNRINLSRYPLERMPELVPSAAQLGAALDDAEAVARELDLQLAVSVPVPPCVVDPSRYTRLHFGWCPRGSDDAYYTISHNGLLRPCNHSSLVLGDLRTSSLRELVGSARCRAFWAPVPPQCLTCPHPLAEQCRGGCPAAADECYGSRRRLDPLVELNARRAG